MKKKAEPRRYSFKNISDKMTVHVKELRKSLSPGKEVEWEGILNPNTQRLVDGKFLEIKDLGPSSGGSDEIAKARKMLESDVKKIIKKQMRVPEKDGASVSVVKHGEDTSSSTPSAVKEVPPVEKKTKKKSDRLSKLVSKGTKGKE